MSREYRDLMTKAAPLDVEEKARPRGLLKPGGSFSAHTRMIRGAIANNPLQAFNSKGPKRPKGVRGKLQGRLLRAAGYLNTRMMRP